MTVVEVETRKVALEAELATALEAAKVLTPATPEFDEAYSRYLSAKASLTKIPDELSKALIAQNADAIAAIGVQIADAIEQLADGLKVADLLGTPLIALRYAKDAEGKKLVVFNPIIKVKAAGGTRKAGTGRTVVVDAEGNRLSLTKFVLAHATDAEKDAAHADYLKYPHAAVDTKPKFEAWCQSHTLTGFTYETPSATTEETAS